jgi:hypothetical protein
MPRLRPPKIVTAAAAVLVLALVCRAADPDWARAAGLDVWNIDREEEDLRQQGAEAARLRAWQGALEQRYELNRLLVRDVAAGRRPLAAAAEELWQGNQGMPGFRDVLERRFVGPTPVARAAHNLLVRVRHDAGLPKDAKAAALVRLRAEYAAAFGVPLPEALE